MHKAALELAAQRIEAHAPYLAQQLTEHPDILKALTQSDPEVILAEHIQAMQDLAVHESAHDDLSNVMSQMRRLKKRAHLIIALCDLSRIWTWDEASRALSRFADAAVSTALICAARYRGIKLGAGETPPGLFVLALGKYGANELNYSSDIDIILLYDPHIFTLGDRPNPEKILLRFAQSFVKILDTLDHDGYVFRTDLRLRPDPRSNAIIVSSQTAERYYETLGQNWERAAMIKARVCAGDRACGQGFIDEVLAPFIWRRSLDFAAIDDIRAMKRQINSAGGHEHIHPAGHNLKLGRGGIREIEFYAQTQQLILGGRHKDLRAVRTDDALTALSDGGYVKPETAEALIEDYGVLRDLEHRAQMINDAQTHLSPESDEERAGLAELYGFDDLASFDAMLSGVLSRVNGVYSALYSNTQSLASEQGSLVFTGVEPDPDTRETLARLGYERLDQVWTIMAGWLGGRIAATRTERAREVLTRLAPVIIEVCAKTGRADDAFFRFDAFFSKLKTGVSILLMFEGRPAMLEDLILMLVLAPRLSDVLSQNPASIDAMIEPEFFSRAVTLDAAEISQAGDLENVMNAARRSVKDAHFQLSAQLLRGSISARSCAQSFTALADEAVSVLCRAVQEDMKGRFGDMPGACAVLAMGKMGGREMTMGSDLDIMVIYDPRDHEPATAHHYFTKYTQRLISALSAPTEAGTLYEVDMALRPSGKKGPITVSVSAFESYYAHEAWTWEFLALTRARIAQSTDAEMSTRLSGLIDHALTHLREPAAARADIVNMRALMDRERPAYGPWDIKLSAGGLVDIEFIVQGLQNLHGHSKPEILMQNTQEGLKALKAAKVIPAKDYDVLSAAARLYETLLQIKAICLSGKFDPQDAPRAVMTLMSQRCGFESFEALSEQYQKCRRAIRPIFDDLIGGGR